MSYWLREFPLSEKRILELCRSNRKKNEAKIEKFRIAMRKKREYENRKIYNKYQEKFINLSRETLFVAGLMLYLAEGNKKDYYKIVLTNTDFKVIKFFIYWLNEFLDIPKNKMKAGLYLYENMDIENEKEIWRKKIGFQKLQFYKPSIRKLQKGSFSYRESYRHGTCSIYFIGGEKKRELMMAIDAFLDKIIIKKGA